MQSQPQMQPGAVLPSESSYAAVGVLTSSGGLKSYAEISAVERAAYAGMFAEQSGGTGRVAAQTALLFFGRSGLPNDVLARIWDLADIDKDGALDQPEFVLAMHLARAARKGVPMPAALPRELFPPQKSLYNNASVTGVGQWQQFGAADSTFDAAPAAPARVEFASNDAFGTSSAPLDKVREKDDHSMMPQYALRGATFEQKIAFEGELNDALRKKNEQQLL